jgi:outer membrane immunogenic protein
MNRQMKMWATAGIASLGFAALGAAAHAADIQRPVYKAPVAAKADHWSGFYIGAHAGYGRARTSSTVTPNAQEIGIGAGDPEFGPLPGSPRADGFVGGGQLGINQRFGSFLAGVEADLTYANLDGSTSATGAPFIGGVFHTALQTRLDWFGTVRGRLGILPTENLLLYATGGVAFGDVKTSLIATNLLNPCGTGAVYCTAGASSSTSVGWTLGGGAEFALTPAWSFKVEYLHIDFGSKSMTAIDPAQPGGAITATAKVRAGLVRAGLNYHF